MTTLTINKETSMDEIRVLLGAKRRAILVSTFEEARFLEELKVVAEAKDYHALHWSVTSGLYDLMTDKKLDNPIYDPIKLMDFVDNRKEPTIFILKDFHDVWERFQAKRALRDILEREDKVYKPIIILSHEKNIPAELEKLITVVEFDLPKRDQVIELLEGAEQLLVKKSLPLPGEREREAIIHALIGMTQSEIVQVLQTSIVKNQRIVPEQIMAEKEQVIKKTGLLEYITDVGDMSEVGGLDVLKDWLEDAKFAFGPEAAKYRVDPVRGAVVTGIPGVGKSLISRSVADMWNLPLLKMNMSWIMDSKVGASEKNIDRALRLAEAVAPCVLWLDEIEKALSGVQSSNQSDAGTTSRVFSSILTWLSDRKAPVFIVATANNITSLPPELTRAGRFDEVFFVSLPHQKEREDILKIHLKKRGYEIIDSSEVNVFEMLPSSAFTSNVVASLAKDLEGFTGAEIEQVVSESGRRALAQFKRGKRDTHHVTEEDLRNQMEQVIPMSKRNPELIQSLRDWAKGAAKCASSDEHVHLHGGKKGKSKLFTLDDFEPTRGSK